MQHMSIHVHIMLTEGVRAYVMKQPYQAFLLPLLQFNAKTQGKHVSTASMLGQASPSILYCIWKQPKPQKEGT